MSEAINIKYLEQHEIDKDLWDRCVDQADNGLVYGYSYYLDHMADHWDGLVLNNYEAVMPLPWKKKYGIHYLYQPFLTAQLGLFGKQLNSELLKAFLDKIPSKFKLWEFSLNHANIFHLSDYHLYERRNYVLDLNSSYDQLYSNYKDNSKLNNKKAVQYGCQEVRDVHLNRILHLVKEQPAAATDMDLARLANVFYYLHNE